MTESPKPSSPVQIPGTPRQSSFEASRSLSREQLNSGPLPPDAPPPKVKALKIIVVGDPSIFVISILPQFVQQLE